MNVLLDAYFDCNYGDDIFIKGITSLFPMHKFYAFLEFYPEKIVKLADAIPNLFLLPESELFLDKHFFDAYVCVGGDIFPDGADYDKRKKYIKTVKDIHGKVLFVGFSMFHSYSERTGQDIREMMEEADLIAPRDLDSVSVLKEILPEKEIISMADLAFSTGLKDIKPSPNKKGILGISVRKPGNTSEEAYKAYIAGIRNVVECYLEENKSGNVRLFGLSDGINSDTPVIEDILNEQTGEEKEWLSRIEKVIYQGDIGSVAESFAECDLVICTRFHAVLTCIASDIPFIPIAYEIKTNHLFHEMQYNGEIFSFENIEGISDKVREFWQSGNAGDFKCSATSIKEYISKSDDVIPRVKELLNGSVDEPAGEEFAIRKQVEEFSYSEIIYGKEEAEKQAQRKAEQEKIKEYVSVTKELNEKNAEYFKLIEELNTKNAEYFKLIEELNAKNGEYFKNIEDLNAELALIKQDWRYKVTHPGKK